LKVLTFSSSNIQSKSPKIEDKMINNTDLRALQSYVRANDETQFDDLHADTLVLDITHSNLKQRHIEIRFDKHTTISTLRDKVSIVLLNIELSIKLSIELDPLCRYGYGHGYEYFGITFDSLSISNLSNLNFTSRFINKQEQNLNINIYNFYPHLEHHHLHCTPYHPIQKITVC
jgi:hypothetical protein